MSLSITQKAERFPPILCRLLARKRYGRPMTLLEIAEASHMTPHEVESLSQSTTWEGVDIFRLKAFTSACGVDFDDSKQLRRAEDYLSKQPTFRYLRSSTEWTTYYLPLLKRLRRSYGESPSQKLWPPLRALLVRLNLLK